MSESETPLVAERFFRGSPRSGRHAVRRDNPHILEALAADLDQAIGDLALLFGSLLTGLRDRKAGEATRAITLSLFDLWCEKALIVSPRQAGERLEHEFANGELAPGDLVGAFSGLGLSGPGAAQAAEALSALPQAARCESRAVADALWPAYGFAARKLCAQSAHVLVARALLYRIGEDQGVFPRLLSGEEMEKALAERPPAVVETPLAAVELCSRVRRSMEEFLPAVYALGEFDWWLVSPDKRATLSAVERSWLRGMDQHLERAAQHVLRMLNSYFFGQVDVDVWRNVYQHYLPAEERQRLGGFYTPDELVHLVLDLAGYEADVEGLCHLTFLDPACGSGAFVTNALARLLEHLQLDLPCHAGLRGRLDPEWKRAEAILQIAAHNLHAVDVHPFAAFLTTLNALFLLMPLYVKAREKNRDFSIDLQVFAADSLEKHDEDLREPDLFASLNARVQLTAESLRRYQEMLTTRFDRVFGNPPWGGVLKGALAPVYDEVKKERFAREYPAAARGKYDVYGLFVERALQILKPGGRFALLTQGSFIDKEWAAGLRALLTSHAQLRYIVDLNPFGQLFFHAMNTPCVLVADALRSPDGKGECTAILSMHPQDFGALNEQERRARVEATVREAMRPLPSRTKAATIGFARAARVPLKRLRETAKGRWDLSAFVPSRATFRKDCLTAADVLEMRQGVTPGGCLDLFLMSEAAATELGIEPELVHRAIKSREIQRWRVTWAGRVLFYPYEVSGGVARPALTIDRDTVQDEALGEELRRWGVQDALDFDCPLDEREKEIVRRRGVNQATVAALLKHRIALHIVKYPGAASYLVRHYERLEGRIFEKKHFTQMGKRWYEYHRPREPRIVLARRRIVSPTLVREVRFALDTVGYLSDHACLYLQPTAKTRQGQTMLREQLAHALDRRVSLDDVLRYCLAFLNSDYAQERLVVGHRPTPKGSYAISEEYLRELPVPPPQRRTAAPILDLVSKLVEAPDQRATSQLEDGIRKRVKATLEL